MKRLLVTGGRTFPAWAAFNWMSIHLEPMNYSLLIHGGAKGADTGADLWGKKFCVPLAPTPVQDWTKRYDGNLRNAFMLQKYKPDVLLTFPGNTGTRDMVQRCLKSGLKVIYAFEHDV